MNLSKEVLEELNSLRHNINEDVDYKILRYNYFNKKDHWACLCSAMDWIDVAKETIITTELNKTEFKYIWRDLYSYLSAVDIIVEAISQIYNVAFGKKHKIDIFDDAKDIFKNNPLNVSDYDYFKHIRAVFGAHPVSIKEKSEKYEYKFASWPIPKQFIVGTNYDYSVFIYSSNKKENHQIFGFNIDEINKYLSKYVLFLPEIYKKIDEEKEKFYLENKNINTNLEDIN